MHRLFTRFFFPKADVIVANSQYAAHDLKYHFSVPANKVSYIHNAIDTEYIAAKVEAKSIEPLNKNKFRFIHIGAFKVGKNHELLIDAFNEIATSEDELILIGSGELKDAIKSKIDALGLEDKVTIVGFSDNPFAYLVMSDCFVLSSDFEGFPNVLLEALACDLPVISTDCFAGPREILAPKTECTKHLIRENEFAEYGILVPVANLHCLSSAMRRIKTDSALRKRYIENAPARIRDLTLNKVAARFEKLLTEK